MRFDIANLGEHEHAAKLRPGGPNTAKIFESPTGHGLLGTPLADTSRRTWQPFRNMLLETCVKFNSPALAAAERVKASAILDNTSTLKRIADGLRRLDGGIRTLDNNLHTLDGSGLRLPVTGIRPLEMSAQQKGQWRSIYEHTSGIAAIRRAAQQPLVSTTAFTARNIAGWNSPAFTAVGRLDSFVTSSAIMDIARLIRTSLSFSQQVGEWLQSWSSAFTGIYERLRELVGQWPLDPYGEPVPIWNVSLYRLAQAAYYENDYMAQARFLDEIGADASADNVLFIQDLLKPTFDPDRLDRRAAWEQRSPADARRWLRGRLHDIRNGGKDKHELLYEEYPNEETPGVALVTPSKAAELMNPDGGWNREPTHVNGASPSALAEFMKRESERALFQQLRAILPERQYQVLLCLAVEMPYDEIAYHLGIGVSTVKTHVRYLRQKDHLKVLLSS